MKPLARKLKISWPDFPLIQSCERVFRLGWTSTSVYFALSAYPIHPFPSAVIPLNLSLENSKRLFSETLMPNSTDSLFVIPLLCGHHSPEALHQALSQCSHSQMLSRIKESVPPTLRQLRSQKLKITPLGGPKTGDFQRNNSA